MIAKLTGIIAAKALDQVLLDVHDVGYRVSIPLSTYYDLSEVNTTVSLQIHTYVREDTFQLFGFLTTGERDVFEALLRVTKVGPKLALGAFGELHPQTLRRLGIEGTVAAFEIDLGALPAPRRKTTARRALGQSDLLPVTRDFAFLLDEGVAAEEVVRAAAGADKALIEEVSVFDLFAGKGVPDGKKSLAIEVTLQPREKTLTDQEIEAVCERIVTAVAEATGGELRG